MSIMTVLCTLVTTTFSDRVCETFVAKVERLLMEIAASGMICADIRIVLMGHNHKEKMMVHEHMRY